MGPARVRTGERKPGARAELARLLPSAAGPFPLAAAARVRLGLALMKTNLADLYRTDPIRACRLALRRTARLPAHSCEPGKDRIDVINRLLEMHGTEAIRGAWQNGYWCDVCAVYANAGETYAPTVIEVREDGPGAWSRFIVSTVGDFVERNERRLGLV